MVTEENANIPLPLHPMLLVLPQRWATPHPPTIRSGTCQPIRNTLTGREFVELATEAFGAKYKLSLLPKFMIRILGLFIPALGESVGMLYQNQYDYQFDSSKYVKHFKHEATPYQEGIKQTAA